MDRGTANERAWTWPQGRATALGSITRLPGLGEFAHWSAHGLRAAIAAETAPGRLVPWMPIAFGLGVVVYFAAEREPSWIAATALAAAAALLAFLVRRRAVAFASALLIATAAIGFCRIKP